MDQIIEEGRQAFSSGVEMRRCPYRDDMRRDAWLKGWMQARMESRRPG